VTGANDRVVWMGKVSVLFIQNEPI